MDNIEVNDIKNIDSMSILSDGTTSATSKSNIFFLVDYNLEEAIHDIGLDREISKFSGDGEKYRSILANYERNYLTGSIKKDNDVIEAAYAYVEHLLDTSIILYSNGEIVTLDGETNGLLIFNALYDKYKDTCNKYRHINNFMDYYNKKTENDSMKRK